MIPADLTQMTIKKIKIAPKEQKVDGKEKWDYTDP